MKKAAQRDMHTEPNMLQLDNPFVTPNKDDSLQRYYSNIDHFVSLFDYGLFFTKIALFDDKEEGNLPEKNNREILEVATEMNQIYNPQWIGNTVIGSNPPFYSRLDADSLSRQMFASCWNLGEDQDINLWDRFGNKTVAIKTTVDRIKKGVAGYNQKYGISRITYIDYKDENADFNLGLHLDNDNQPKYNIGFNYRRFLHKDIKYRNENEVRLVLFDSYYSNLLAYYIYTGKVKLIDADIDQNEFRNVWYSIEIDAPGIYLPIDSEILIEEIIISEHASKETKTKIYSAAKRYGLEDRVAENTPSQRQRVFSNSNMKEYRRNNPQT